MSALTHNVALVADAVGKPTSKPVRKVTAGGIAGAGTAVLVFVLNSYLLPSSKPIPPEIASALTTVITFLVSYLISPGYGERTIATSGS